MFCIRGLLPQLKKNQPRKRHIGQRSGGGPNPGLPGVLSSGGAGRGGCHLLPPLQCDSSHAVQAPSEASPSPGVWRLTDAQTQTKHMAGLYSQLLTQVGRVPFVPPPEGGTVTACGPKPPS